MVTLVPILLATASLVLMAAAELIHHRRVRAVAPLVFGPSGKPTILGRLGASLRVASVTALVWGLATLLLLPPAAHRSIPVETEPADREHLLIVLDVSPSMRLQDAGPDGKESRTARARAVLDSVFARVARDRLFMSVIAVYNGAKPVVEETRDMEVIHNLLNDLPMHYAFPSGKTKLLDGIAAAAETAKKWPRGSATLVLVSDGDSVPPTGMPKLPPAVGGVLVIGVGDPLKGTFIDGRNSRQDAATLRQIANRLGGQYHDANQKLVPTATLSRLGSLDTADPDHQLGRREWALLATSSGALVLGLLPVSLLLFGTRFHPGPTRPRIPFLAVRA
ncbi:vWA domain-containing protein [Haloferula sargassicola]|uniref:VWFA domain-containing protein n=1 Tax=Haloferula sargassicola TaxID=490096 RepID=A0ABP9UR79_9BACT